MPEAVTFPESKSAFKAGYKWIGRVWNTPHGARPLIRVVFICMIPIIGAGLLVWAVFFMTWKGDE